MEWAVEVCYGLVGSSLVERSGSIEEALPKKILVIVANSWMRHRLVHLNHKAARHPMQPLNSKKAKEHLPPRRPS